MIRRNAAGKGEAVLWVRQGEARTRVELEHVQVDEQEVGLRLVRAFVEPAPAAPLERAAQRVMSLPMSADLSEAQQDLVLRALRQALAA